MTLQLGQKCFELNREKDDEIAAISVVSLFSSMLENVEGITEVVPGILNLLLNELKLAKTSEYQIMLL